MIRRRHFLQLGAAALAMPSIARAQGVRGQITLMAYTGIFQDNYTATVVEPFQKAFPDVKVNYVPGGTSAAMLGNIRAQKADPQIDVVIMDVTTSSIGNAESLFDKITPAEAPSLNELYPEARAVGGEFGPAVTYDHLVLVYDTQAVKPPLTKLADLWRDDLKGFLSISAPPNIQGLALTAMVEKMEGGDHRTSIDKAVKKLRELSPGVKTFEPNPDGCDAAPQRRGQGRDRLERPLAALFRRVEGAHRRGAAAGGQRVPDQHHQPDGGLEEPRRRRGVRELRAVAGRAEGLHRADVLCAGQCQGADRAQGAGAHGGRRRRTARA